MTDEVTPLKKKIAQGGLTSKKTASSGVSGEDSPAESIKQSSSSAARATVTSPDTSAANESAAIGTVQDSSGTGNSLSAYDNYFLSDSQKTEAERLKALYSLASQNGDTAGAQNYHDQLEGIRALYGYSGGEDGSQYIRIVDDSGLSFLETKSGYINSLQDAWTDNRISALTSAYNRNLASLKETEAQIPEYFQDARNKAASSSEIARRNFSEYAAGSGLNIGAGSEAHLSMLNSYVSSMSGIDKAEANAMKEIEYQRIQIKSAYQDAVAQAKAAGNLQRAQMLYEDAVRVDSSIMSWMQFKMNYDLKVSETEYNRQFDLDQMMFDAGDFSSLSAYGFSEVEIAALKKYYRYKNPRFWNYA